MSEPDSSNGEGPAAHHAGNAAPAGLDDLLARAQAWHDDDPDTHTRAELEDLVGRARRGDADAVSELQDRFAGMLQFGTAGLRGALGAGPNRMNRSLVIRAAAGLTAYLKEGGADPAVVIGYDARRNSDVFARDTAAVVRGAGGSAMVLPHPLPTPVLAFAIRHLGADAGVMVTASHNPPQDNGYKVYLGDGSQIVPPADRQIAEQIAAVEKTREVYLAEEGWDTLGDEIVDDYVDAVVSVLDPGSPRELRVVHTALHGVGSDVVRKAFRRAGFEDPEVVASQAAPDPDFPTVAFPNPEEPGAIDASLELADDLGADLVVANDPDADRCAVAVFDPSQGRWRMLRGDELGALLGAHVLARGVSDGDVFANSIVSSRMLGAMAAAAGVRHEETLTGFKWIGRVEGLRYGYEEAIGYCVAPQVVRDKDGISAALLVAELAASLKAQGRTLLDVLDDLAREHGVYATDAFSVRVAELGLISIVMQRLREHPPASLGNVQVAAVDDLNAADGALPPTDALRYHLDDGSRVIVRPSGTEPKLKVYLEAVVPVGGDLAESRREAAARLVNLRGSMEDLTRI
ncbi:MAG TPA: phospho-sugar mutase [Segeticoccus sp.]|uniref:phospho-sugar mutase n=1 Tax=Segeticoccus sp. TaxID=2706531 RepID=UPI002D7EE2D5|nr:phospho-sugar mutase [Segeticoccus sp.]HET8601222.1 phospho-sugar mutase [Segeticoccus sp.]